MCIKSAPLIGVMLGRHRNAADTGEHAYVWMDDISEDEREELKWWEARVTNLRIKTDEEMKTAQESLVERACAIAGKGESFEDYEVCECE